MTGRYRVRRSKLKILWTFTIFWIVAAIIVYVISGELRAGIVVGSNSFGMLAMILPLYGKKYREYLEISEKGVEVKFCLLAKDLTKTKIINSYSYKIEGIEYCCDRVFRWTKMRVKRRRGYDSWRGDRGGYDSWREDLSPAELTGWYWPDDPSHIVFEPEAGKPWGCLIPIVVFIIVVVTSVAMSI